MSARRRQHQSFHSYQLRSVLRSVRQLIVSLKSFAKQKLLPNTRAMRRIRAGVACGINMELDLQSQFQRYLGFDERELNSTISKLLPSCRSCIDVGANDG